MNERCFGSSSVETQHGIASGYLCISKRGGLRFESELAVFAGKPSSCFGVEVRVRVGSTCTQLPHLWLRFPIKPAKLCLEVAQCIELLEPCGLISKV